MTAADIILLGIIAAALIAAVVFAFRRRRRGGGCCGCSGCSCGCKSADPTKQKKTEK